MSNQGLTFWQRFNQYKVLPVVIAALSCIISLVLTIRLCRELRGAEASIIPQALASPGNWRNIFWQLPALPSLANAVLD